MAKLFKPGKSNLKGIIAGILLVIGFLIFVFANQWAVKQHLVGAVWNTWPDRIYDRVFFSRYSYRSHRLNLTGATMCRAPHLLLDSAVHGET